jgi:hypothetical protein
VDHEVVVQLDGLPRPASVVERDGDRVLVRFRQAGGFEERWVSAADVVEVETTKGVPVPKLVGGAVVAVLGLALVLWPHGSNKPLLSSTATPTPTASASAVPTGVAPSPLPAHPSALLLGDSLSAGKGNSRGTATAVELAAKALGWRSFLLAEPGTGYTTSTSYADRLAAVTNPPDILVLEGGASDTDASTDRLTAAVTSLLDDVKRRFPDTRVVVLGTVAMDQPPDPGLVRVDRTLAAVARAKGVLFVDPMPWITSDNSEKYLARTGFYPNAAGHRYLGSRLAAAFRALDLG